MRVPVHGEEDCLAEPRSRETALSTPELKFSEQALSELKETNAK